MLFNTYAFCILVIITWGLYYLRPFRRFQVPILVVASLVFYAWERPSLLLLLIASMTIYAITSYAVMYGQERKRAVYAAIGVTMSLSVLAFFKYSPLLAHTFALPKSSVAEFLVTIPLPVGISFYTFHGISLMIDAFRSDRVPAYRFLVEPSFARHYRNVALFISFFPQLVAGPILKAHDFLPQIAEKNLSEIRWAACFRHLVLGYFLKMVVADNLKDYTFWIQYPYFERYDTISLLAMLCGYSMQIFADFSGYSLIAIGLAGLFCYNVKINFNFPYIASTFSEFWTRWHISLSTFLKEYLYIPLGGNRRGQWRTYLNLMATMFLGGLWHGAAWSYAIWGTCHGLALAIERFVRDRVKFRDSGCGRWLGRLVVFSVVTFSWLLFKLSDFGHVVKYVEAMWNNRHETANGDLIFMIGLYSLPVVLYHAAYLMADTRVGVRFERVKWVVYGVMLFLIVTNSGSRSAFIYFQF